MAKLVKWGREQDSTCTCGAPVESAAHVMLRCPTRSNAITAAHDSVLTSIRQALRDRCSCFTQHWCTAAGSLFPTLTADFPALACHLDGPRFVHLERQVPDAIFVQEDGTRVVILELARTDDLLGGYWRGMESTAPFGRPSLQSPVPQSLRPPLSSALGAAYANRSGGLKSSPLPYPRRYLRNSDAVPFAVRFKRPGQYEESGTRLGANHR